MRAFFSLAIISPAFATQLTVGFWKNSRYDLQNSYALNFFTKLQNYDFTTPIEITTKYYEDLTELRQCLTTKQCQATLDYSGQVASQDLSSIEMPTLNDRPIYLTHANQLDYFESGIATAGFWFVSYFTLFYLVPLIFSRNKWLEKP